MPRASRLARLDANGLRRSNRGCGARGVGRSPGPSGPPPFSWTNTTVHPGSQWTKSGRRRRSRRHAVGGASEDRRAPGSRDARPAFDSAVERRAGRPDERRKEQFAECVGGLSASAIVHPTPGTTRDAVAVTTAIEGWPVELCDTAGLRAADAAAERAGIEPHPRTPGPGRSGGSGDRPERAVVGRGSGVGPAVARRRAGS